MKKKILILLIIFAAAIVPACPRPITLMARSTFQHRRMRMPSKTHVTADYEDGVLVLHFLHIQVMYKSTFMIPPKT